MGLSNANSLVMDTPAVCTVVIYRCINALSEGLHGVLHEVLHNARPPDIASWCQRLLRSRAVVLLIYYAPKSYNLLILI